MMPRRVAVSSAPLFPLPDHDGGGPSGTRVHFADAPAAREDPGRGRIEKRRRRILLANTSQRLGRDLAQALALEGHEVVHTASRGVEVLSAVEHMGAVHALVLSQGILGAGWPAMVRQLRRRAPRVPIILFLRSGAECDWRFAFMAGAFDALPASAGTEAVLAAIRRALDCPAGRDLAACRSGGRAGTGGTARPRQIAAAPAGDGDPVLRSEVARPQDPGRPEREGWVR